MESGARSVLLRLLLAGLWLSACEVLLVVLLDRRLFLSDTELRRYLIAGASVPTAALVLGGGGVWLVLRRMLRGSGSGAAVVAKAAASGAFLVSGGVLWLSSGGRRLRDLPLRPVVVVVLAALTGWVAWLAVRGFDRLLTDGSAQRRKRVAMVLAALSAVALVVDSIVLRRLYPALHAALALAALTGSGLAAAAWPEHPTPRRLPRALPTAFAALVTLVALTSLVTLRGAPNARFAVSLAAPITGKALQLVPGADPESEPPAPTRAPQQPAAAAPIARGSVDLRGTDVLLITIDALRADRLRALGGSGATPELDRLAEESVVFERTYTPTPHTSYALSSLFTGKYLRQVLALPDAPTEHPTLPELLREHGFRTAAFYPPAVFFVDAERFKALAERRFGFEYAKEMFAPAADRVGQLEQYLRQAPADRRLFVWVHLFEPHEPYDPPPAFARGEQPVERYDGEVAAADAATGELVRAFRRARPGAAVIVTSDHGEEFGEHGGLHHGTTLYDEQVRVPLLWWAPGKLAPHRVSAPANLVDLVPSLLSALGIPRDARMRGRDLGPALSGSATEASEVTFAPNASEVTFAPNASEVTFASIDALRMVTDGRHKLLCDPAAGGCRLFDLVSDPLERRDVSELHADVRAHLQQQLSELVGSIPRVEAMAMQGGGGWPEALARAALGDPNSGPDVVPLLGSPRPEVRAEAARRLGELGYANARATLASLREHDAEPSVRAEAALAGLRLDDASALPGTVALLGAAEPVERERRAALVLSAKGEAGSAHVLLTWAADATAALPERRAALDALGALRSPTAVAGLVALLDDVNLRVQVVQALARIGGKTAANAIARALSAERYPEARQAEAEALVELKDRRALAAIWRWLGTPSSMPEGVKLLQQLGALSPPSGRGALLNEAAREGAWQCSAEGCEPGTAAVLRLPRRQAPRGAVRVTVLARSPVDGVSLSIAGQPMKLALGNSEVGVELPAWTERMTIEAAPGVVLIALAVAPATEDVPPPPPEPWQATPAVDGTVP